MDAREESGGLGQRARGREEGSAGVRDGAVTERGKEGGGEGGGRRGRRREALRQRLGVERAELQAYV